MTTKQKFEVEDPEVVVLANGRFAYRAEPRSSQSKSTTERFVAPLYLHIHRKASLRLAAQRLHPLITHSAWRARAPVPVTPSSQAKMSKRKWRWLALVSSLNLAKGYGSVLKQPHRWASLESVRDWPPSPALGARLCLHESKPLVCDVVTCVHLPVVEPIGL
eukprot:scaffold15973_cov137-Isochrysis_galbana.AAC.10